MGHYAQSGGNYAGPFSRRTFLRLGTVTTIGLLAASSVPNYRYPSTPKSEIEQRLQEIGYIRAGNRRLAQQMFATQGIEAVRANGLEHYLIDNELQQMDAERAMKEQPERFFVSPTIAKMLVFSGATGIAYATGPTLLEKMYDAYLALQHKAKAGTLTEREMKSYAGIAAVLGYTLQSLACSGGGEGIPTAPSNKATINTKVLDSESRPVNGVIDYMGSESGPIVASGPISNGNSILENVSGTIKRVRVRANGDGSTFLNHERDLLQQIVTGNNNVEVMVKSRTPNLPFWYNETNRNTYPVHNKKTVGPIKFIANPAGITGNQTARLEVAKDAVKYAAPILTGLPYIEGETFQTTDSTIEPGNNIFPIRFSNAFGATQYKYDGNNRLLGTVITLPRFADRTTDVSEIAGGTRFPGESNLIRPSIANDNLPWGIFEGCDLEALAASEFDALKAREFTSMDNVKVDNWWTPGQR